MPGGKVDFVEALFRGVGERGLEQVAGSALAALGGEDAGAEFGGMAADSQVDEGGELPLRLQAGEAVVVLEVDAFDVGGNAVVG